MNNSHLDENKHAARRRYPPVSSRLSGRNSGGFERSHFSGLSVFAAVLLGQVIGIRCGVSAKRGWRSGEGAYYRYALAISFSPQVETESQTASGAVRLELTLWVWCCGSLAF